MTTIANLLVQLKNAQAVGAENIAVPFSNLKLEIARILKDKGFIVEVEKKMRKARQAEIPYLQLKLKYTDGAGAINGIKLISKSSRRVYGGKLKLYPVKSGFGIAVVSTSKGLMTGQEARKAGVGGEILFEIW
ncbi:MAG: 30S ribosomal protein S8 [Patescibacteria group bacterium]